MSVIFTYQAFTRVGKCNQQSHFEVQKSELNVLISRAVGARNTSQLTTDEKWTYNFLNINRIALMTM